MNFFMLGGCEIHDTIKWLKQGCPQHNFIEQGMSTLGSIYSPQGKIAEHTYNWYTKNNLKSNPIARAVYKEIVSKPWLKDVKENVYDKKDNWIIISFALEGEARYEDGQEHVTLIKELVNKPNNKKFEKIVQLKYPTYCIDKLNDHNFTMGWENEFVGKRYLRTKGGGWLDKLGQDIHDHFEDRVILIYTPPARKWFNRKFGVYHQLPKHGDWISWHTGYWKNRTKDYWEEHSWERTNRNYQGLYKGFQRYYPKKTHWIKMEWENLVGDEHHRFGKSPFHYDNKSIKKIGNAIQGKINEIEAAKSS